MNREFTIRLNLNSDQTAIVTDEAYQETKFYTKVKFFTMKYERVHFRDKDKHSIKETRNNLLMKCTTSDHRLAIDQDN